jgi:hypothetical protein
VPMLAKRVSRLRNTRCASRRAQRGNLRYQY